MHHELARNASPRPRRRPWTATWVGGLALGAVCLAAYMPGLFVLPPIDRDEPRFAEASRTMAESGDWRDYVVPRVQGRPRLNKPPLIYWLQVAAVRALGGDGGTADRARASAATHVDASALSDAFALPLTGGIWRYRVPSVLAALTAALLTWRIGLSMFPGPCAWLAGLLLGTCTVVMIDSRQARADEALLACTTLAQLALWHVWSALHAGGRPKRGWIVLFWIAVGLGAMAKGPVTPAVCAMTIVALCVATRRAAWVWRLRPALGLVILAAMIAPWVALVARAVGWDSFARIVIAETFGRSVTAKEGHWGPPGYYLLLLPALFWPGSLALVPGVTHAWHRAWRRPRRASSSRGRIGRLVNAWRARRPGRRAELFCLAWLVPTWVVFEVVATKLPHYTLPLYPALALLCARGLFAVRSAWRPFLRGAAGRACLAGWVVLSVVVGLGVPTALAMLVGLPRDGRLPAAIAIALTLAALLGVVGVRWLRRERYAAAQVALVAAALAAHTALLQFILPRGDRLWLSSRVASLVQQADPAGDRPFAAAGYGEDSLVFLTHGRVERIKSRELPAWLATHADGLAVVDVAPAGLRRPVRTLGTVAGFDYSKGRWETLTLIEPSADSAHSR